jgi:hypothetical protein
MSHKQWKKRTANHIWSLVEIFNLLLWIVNHDANIITMMSGDRCDTEGLYWAAGCGHAYAIDFLEFAVFPVCKTCKQSIKWIHRKPVSD